MKRPRDALTSGAMTDFQGVDMHHDSPSDGYAKSGMYDHREDDPMIEALRALRTAPPDERDAFWTSLRVSMSKTTPELEAERLAEFATKRTEASGLVYYIRFADRVKIGHTGNLPARLKSLPHDEVLATEPGTTHDERARHATFDELRVVGEWFRFEEPLVSHIAALQSH